MSKFIKLCKKSVHSLRYKYTFTIFGTESRRELNQSAVTGIQPIGMTFGMVVEKSSRSDS